MITFIKINNCKATLLNEQSGKKISVIINCLNGQEFLNEAIESVLNQTYTNWEIVFLDNCSTDKSIEIVKNFNNDKIKIFKSDKHLVCGV